MKLHSDCSKSVQYYYGCYDPLQYPLMFPFGELDRHQHIPKKKDVERGNGRNVVATVEIDTLLNIFISLLEWKLYKYDMMLAITH